MRRWKIAVTVGSLTVGACAVAVYLGARHVSKRFEPYIRERAIEYLSQRFESEVELTALHVTVPKFSPVRLLLDRGRGSMARVEGEGIQLRHRGRRDVPPLFRMRSFQFEVDLGRLFEPTKHVETVLLRGMEIHIPPKGDRPQFHFGGRYDPEKAKQQSASVILGEVILEDATLVLMPRRKDRKPLRFSLHHVRLESAGVDQQMRYNVVMTNPRPPGKIDSRGLFGPWNADEPGDTPLKGAYEFSHADLGVFSSIHGILHSTGTFRGTLSSVEAAGEARVPDFGLKRSSHRLPLYTRFEVLVDGTNGDTVLRPVHARLGQTEFRTSGAVIKHDGDMRRRIHLEVNMPAGHLNDLMRLAAKGPPLMEGLLDLKAKIDLPPLSGKVVERLVIDGRFAIQQGRFLKSNIQDKIDTLSRRGQGTPNAAAVDEVFSRMTGSFHLEDQALTFRELGFAVPGAQVQLAGGYDMDNDVLDFKGSLKLDATVSRTMTGWKRVVLKPADPFFSKNGAGTFLKIQVTGSSKDPKFGRAK